MSPRWYRQAYRRLSGARYRRRTDRASLGNRACEDWSTSVTSKSTGHSVKINLPKTAIIPEIEFEWQIPKWSNAIERDRARTYFQAYAAAQRCTSGTGAEELHAGRHKTWTEFKVPEEAIGCGFHEAVRGVLSHHVVIRKGKIANYHPYPPTPWNANPRDVYGTPGPYEDAVQNTPIFEENGPTNSKASTSCARFEVLTRACPAESICISERQGPAKQLHTRPPAY